MKSTLISANRLAQCSGVAASLAILVLLGSSSTLPRWANAQSSVMLAISNVPLTVTTPAHPQVLIAVGNSQSMDGTLSGALMTGSGTYRGNLASLNASSSPITYSVPAGFAPPVQAADAAGNAPYTVTNNGTRFDNGASRLNVAKAGISAIIQAYIQNTDFALETYSTSNTGLFNTWVYYMSPPGSAFIFSSTRDSDKRYVANPCLGYPTGSSVVKNNCTAIANTGLYTVAALSTSLYMQIGAASDDPDINDVFYSYNEPGVFVNYGSVTPSTPYPPNYSLQDYRRGQVSIRYASSVPSASNATTPTNAGFAPFSQQVFYAERGFGYGGNQSANLGNINVAMTSAGVTPTAASVAAAVNAFTPLLAPESNDLSSAEIKAVAGQSPTAGLLASAQTYLSSVSTPASGCVPKQYVVLISDGLPTQDLNGELWPPLGSAAARGYGVTASFNPDGSLAATNDQALTDAIANLTNLRNAGIKTFVIGLGAGVDPTINSQAAATLQAMAIAGGSSNYYPATTPAALVDNLNSILVTVQSGSLSTTSAAVNSTRLQNGSVEYQSNFTSSDASYQDWTGNLYEKALDPVTGSPTGSLLWSAQTLLDSQVAGSGWSTSRLIATWNSTLNSNAGGGTPLRWNNLSAAQQTLLQPADSAGQNRVDYLRGNQALEQHNGGTLRNRSHVLGDIIDSQPVYVGTPVAPYFSTSYRSFKQAQAARRPMLYVGANDGMLHAFNAATGVEQFAFVPNAVFANLKTLTDPLYNQSHRFYVDGSPQVGDVQFADNSWHTLLIGGEGAGGKSIYALDITNPQMLTSEAAVASAALWEFTDGDMGLSYSEPQIAPINASQKFAVFFGNGYNSPNNSAVLYAVNPRSGQIIKKIDLCAAVVNICNSALPQGLSTVAIGNSDGLQGQPITQIYAGDLQGNLWAVDVANSDVTQWRARLLFQARDSGGNPQPITTTPVVTLHPDYPRQQGQLIMLGTGRLLTLADLSSQQKQSVYGIWDKPGMASAATRSDLQSQVLTAVSAATSGLPQDVLTDTSNTVDWRTKRGWVVDLLIPGQSIVTYPQLLNGAFLVTLNTPPANACSAKFSSALLELNFKNGGGFDKPQLDINGDRIIDNSDKVNSNYAVSVGLGVGFASAPTVIGPNQQNQMLKLVTQSGGQQVSVRNPNSTPRRTTWWQLQ